MKKYFPHILIILHTVGVVGLQTEYKDWFLALTPVNLIITYVIALLSVEKKLDVKFWIVFALAFVVGFGAEWIGVHTGYLFGDYEYGEGLGPKWLDIPLAIGMNWALLILVTRSLANRWVKNEWGRTFIASILMVVLDLWMEPVAPTLDYWEFVGGVAPMKNYLGWFVVSFFIHAVASFLGASKWKCGMDKVIYIVQSIFFIILAIASFL